MDKWGNTSIKWDILHTSVTKIQLLYSFVCLVSTKEFFLTDHPCDPLTNFRKLAVLSR